MMTTNVNDNALGASARHFHIVSRSGNDNNNNVDDDNKCLRQGLRRERRAFYIALCSGLSVSLTSCHNPFQSLAKWALD